MAFDIVWLFDKPNKLPYNLEQLTNYLIEHEKQGPNKLTLRSLNLRLVQLYGRVEHEKMWPPG